MRYFYVPLDNFSGNKVRITGRELHHLLNVLRLHEGDEISILDGSGGTYKLALLSCQRDVAIGEIKTVERIDPPKVEVALLVGLTKSDKMDMIVQKATELGASKIIPIFCERSVPKLSSKQLQQRIARWNQIVIEASKQSHRPFFPFISNILDFQEALEASESRLKLLFVADFPQLEFRIARRLKDILKANICEDKIDILIGPEGDFTPEEIAKAISIGAVPVSLGKYVLRTETAAISALSILLYEKS